MPGYRSGRELAAALILMPFRATFTCLWCGRRHQVRAPGDLEGWAQLCPGCLGQAGGNEFLRFRLKRALAERAASAPLPDQGRQDGPGGSRREPV